VENSGHPLLLRGDLILDPGACCNESGNAMLESLDIQISISRYFLNTSLMLRKLSLWNVTCSGWTRVHTYFTIMGGFFDSEWPDSALSALDVARLTADSHPMMFRVDAPTGDPSKEHDTSPSTPPPQPRILVTKSEIVDKSKSDTLGKLFTVLQTTWFIVQYSVRWAAHQPRTQLEVMTLAYAAINIIVYILWWEKPLDVQEPINVRGRAAIADVRQKTLSGAWFSVIEEAFRSLTTGVKTLASITVLPAVGVLFGGVHCIAWRFPFPTKAETELWKVCAVYCSAYPIAVPVVLLLGAIMAGILKWMFYLSDEAGKRVEDVLAFVGGILGFLSLLIYISCRIILLVLTFTCLRLPPRGVYEATDWIFFFPHIG
jgi:hypothetical protein